MNAKQYAQELIDFLYDNPTPFHVADGGRKMLVEAGFSELDLGEKWDIKPGGKYFTTRNESAIIAFIAGKAKPSQAGFRLIGTHTDAPAIRIKSNPEIVVKEEYLTLNVEMYGGLIYNTWLDRPLAIAGRIAIKGANPLWPEMKMIDIKKPIATIPNLAIHINREINNGYIYNPQKDLLPLIGITDDKEIASDWFIEILAAECGVDKEDILGCDLYLYDYQKGTLNGLNEEFIHVGRLDDVAMSYVALSAIKDSKPQDATIIAACYDNEEVGSRTKQGAASALTQIIVDRVAKALGSNDEQTSQARYQSFFISCDMSHATHPNFPDKHDPTNKPVINGGPVIKYHHGQKYTTDAESAAVFKAVCDRAGVKYQEFHNRNDARSGGTIGPIVASSLDVRALDIGNPMLSMHSIRELAGVKDTFNLLEVFKEFYKI